jgi:hypothetical protein
MTFHVRLVSPPNQTEGLVGLLAADSGVSNLVVLPGTARRPDGDAVQFDLRSGSANSVFRELKAFQAGHGGAVGVKYVDAMLDEETALQLLLNVFVLIAVGALALRLQRLIWRARKGTARPRQAQRTS